VAGVRYITGYHDDIHLRLVLLQTLERLSEPRVRALMSFDAPSFITRHDVKI